MKQQYTPGPWRWEFNEKSKDINLVGGKTIYDLTVMDFVRYGMGGAQPRFNIDHGQDLQLMHKASEMGVIVKGREHHANWFKDINHPDAKLISSAPELLEALQSTLALINSTFKANGWDCDEYQEVIKGREVVKKALGLS